MRTSRNIVLLAFAGVSLAACSSSLPGLSSGAPSLAPSASLPSVAQHTNPVQRSRQPQISMNRPTKAVSISMAAPVGPPSNVSRKLNAKIVAELKRRNINVIHGKAGYNMRGYVVSSSEGSGAKLAYIWDLNNKSGRKQTRITGEKSLAGSRGSDPWAGVDDQVIAAIASDTADQLAGWLVKKNGGVARTVSTRTASTGIARKLRANRIRANKGPSTTASTGKTTLMAMVMPVTGAPGDGKVSLTRAIKTKLYARGIRLTSSQTSSVYQVRGVVQIGKTRQGKQPIRIDWRVYDPRGKRLGTVTQKNEIPQGSLNGSWGPIAEAAAGAAANGITKLLPKSALRS